MMKFETDINIKMDVFEKFEKTITQKGYIKLGILGKNGRKEAGASNSEIGVTHEFGSPIKNIPARSFLRFPLQHEGNWVTKQMAGHKAEIEKAFVHGDKKKFFNLLSIYAYQAVDKAFETSGWGQWRYSWGVYSSLKTKQVSHRPLIETGQLRRSIDTQVVMNGK